MRLVSKGRVRLGLFGRPTRPEPTWDSEVMSVPEAKAALGHTVSARAK
jgi:hypothetical protein